MSNEITTQNKNIIGSKMIGFMAFPMITTGVGAINSIRRNGGIKNALSACEVENFKKLGQSLEPIHKDIFSRSIALSQNYEEYKGISKKAAKYAKKALKAKQGKISLLDNFLNLFRKNKVTPENILSSQATAKNKLNDSLNLIKSGKEIVETSTKTGFKNTAKNLFKNEIKNPIVIAMTALELAPEITGKVIPAFKNEGFIAGLKQTGKSILKVGSNFVSYAAGGAIGRVLGATIGTIICPGAGSAIGASVGDMLGSAIIGSTATDAVNKIIGEDEIIKENKEVENTKEVSQNASGEISTSNNQTENKPISNQEVTKSQQTNNQALTQAEIANIPSFKEARAKYATASNTPSFKGGSIKKGYQKPQNGIYATQWVNEMAQAKRQKQLDTLS